MEGVLPQIRGLIFGEREKKGVAASGEQKA
jgi:hypothetical protein